MDRSEMRAYLRTLLGVESDDQLFTDTRLNTLLEQAHIGLMADVLRLAPDYLRATVTLSESGSGNTYNLAGSVTDFAEILSLKDATSGSYLVNVGLEAIDESRGNVYALTGDDENLVITTGADITGDPNLTLKYHKWSAAFNSDTDPAGIPRAFHELVPLETLFVFELGNEDKVPRTVKERWQARRASFFQHIDNRVAPPTTQTNVNSVSGLRSLVRTFLGVRENDKFFTHHRLNMMLDIAHNEIVNEIMGRDLSYYTKIATLDTPEATTGADSLRFVLANQSSPVTDYARWQEVRVTDKDGSVLDQVRSSELRDTLKLAFSIERDETDGLQLRVSSSVGEDQDIYIKYVYWPAAPSAGTDDATIKGIEPEFVDVVALEALMLLPEAAEKMSALILSRWTDRRASLMSSISQGGQRSQHRVQNIRYQELVG